jgi:hypothetical protein
MDGRTAVDARIWVLRAGTAEATLLNISAGADRWYVLVGLLYVGIGDDAG